MEEPNETKNLLLRVARKSSETNHSLVQACFTDLDFALTTAEVANSATEPEVRQRTLSMGGHAVGLVLARFPYLSMSADERQRMQEKLQAVRRRLQANGIEL